MPMRTFLLLVLCLLLASPAHALVVGRGGAVYPIKEKDFLEVIAERIARIDPQALQEKLQNLIQDEARTFRPHDAVGGLPPAGKDELYRVDLSFTVTPELAKAVVEAMQKHNSVLLTNHGQVVCGKDFDQVYERATFFEMACRIIVQSGGDYSVLTSEEIEDLEIYVLGKKTK